MNFAKQSPEQTGVVTTRAVHIKIPKKGTEDFPLKRVKNIRRNTYQSVLASPFRG